MSFRAKLNEIYINISKRKPIQKSLKQSDVPKTLLWYHLLAYGISATIGGGIYVVIGTIAKDLAGPAVVLSILGSGVLSCLTAFCYLELAAVVPATGSSNHI
jgi:APA family basic amino acid/polyamine antiporter